MPRTAAAALALLILSTPAGAEVHEAAPHGFQVGGEIAIGAPRAVVWETLVVPGLWWNHDHSWFGDAAAMSLEASPGGCWCESGPDGDGATHMTVVFIKMDETLRMAGALGPLQALGASGAMEWSLADDGEGSRLTWRYTVGGFSPGGMEAWAGPVDQVLALQMARLKNVVENPGPGAAD